MLGIRDWDEAPRRGHAAGQASRRDRCGNKKTRRGRVFFMALRTNLFVIVGLVQRIYDVLLRHNCILKL